jgi:hypothetical protein
MAPAEVFASDGDARADRAGLRVGLKQLASGPATSATVGKWWERFWRSGLDGLLDEPRVGGATQDQRSEK